MVLWSLENLWYTWVSETLACTRGFKWLSGFLKALWYTWESDTPGCARGLMVFSGALKASGTLERMRLVGVPEGLWVSLNF